MSAISGEITRVEAGKERNHTARCRPWVRLIASQSRLVRLAWPCVATLLERDHPNWGNPDLVLAGKVASELDAVLCIGLGVGHQAIAQDVVVDRRLQRSVDALLTARASRTTFQEHVLVVGAVDEQRRNRSVHAVVGEVHRTCNPGDSVKHVRRFARESVAHPAAIAVPDDEDAVRVDRHLLLASGC